MSETYLADSTVACHDTLQNDKTMVSLCCGLWLVWRGCKPVSGLDLREASSPEANQCRWDAETQTLMDWTPGAAILDAEITMHGSDQYDFGYIEQGRSAWGVALLVMVSKSERSCDCCWGRGELWIG